MHALLSTCVVPMLAKVESLQTDAERAEHWRHWGRRYRHDEVSLRWIAAADSTVLLATAAADAVLAEATALLSAAQPLNQKSARFLVRRLLALATAFSGPMPASDDGDVDRAYAQPSAAAPLVAARVRVHERCTALTATLYERLQAELADDIVTQQRAVALASVLLAQFGVSFDPFGGAKSRVTVSAFPRRVSPKLGSDPHARRWARAAIAASAVRTYSMIDSVDDAGSGAPSPAGRRLMHALASLASTSLYSDVRKRAQATLQDVADARFLDARTLVDPIVALLAANRGAVTPELEKERDARVTGALHTLTLLAGMPDIMLPTQRLQLLTMVCTHGAKFDRLQSQARLSALFSSLATFYDSYTHPRVSDADLGAAIDQCLAVAQAADAHWRYRTLASVVLMMYALPRTGAIASEQSARVVAHFASSAVGPLRQLRVIGRLATAWLLLHFKRHLTTGAELATASDEEVRAYAARVPTDASDDSDESALYFDGAPWVGRTLDGVALACGVRFARGPVAFVAATQLSAGLRELESRFTDEQYLAKLCELAAVDRVAPDDEASGRSGSGGGDSMSDMTGLAGRMQAGMLMFSGRGGLQSQSGGRFDALFARLAYAAARSFGWTRCGAHLLACANRMAPLHDERGAQVVAVELFAGLARASRRWPTAERAPAREQLTAFLRQHCVLGFSSGDGLDLGVEIAAALRFVANRVDARRVAWLADALHLEWLGDSAHAPAVGNASAQARALDLAATLVHMLGWRGASWCARIAAILQRGIDSQALLRFSQVRVSTGRLVAVTLLATRYAAASQQAGELVRCIVERAAAQSEALELLLVVALADAMLSPAFVDELPRIVPTVLEGQRDNDPERALMARHTAALLVQYGMSAAHVDTLIGTLRTLVVANADPASWQSRRVALPMLQLLAFRNRFALQRIDASVLEIARAALLDARIEVRESAEGLIASVLRGQALSLGVAQLRADFVTQARSKDATRQHAGVLGLAALMASEPYNVPTWLLDVAQALAQHSSASSRVCRDAARRAASEFFRTRGRAIDELGVTAAGDESEAELLAANERLVRVAAQLRELSATQTHYA